MKHSFMSTESNNQITETKVFIIISQSIDVIPQMAVVNGQNMIKTQSIPWMYHA